MKKVWITALEREQESIRSLMTTLPEYGLAVNGQFWVDDLKNFAWMSAQEELFSPETSLWVLLGSKKSLEKDSVRFGLSLLAITLQAGKGLGFPILWIGLDPEPLDTGTLPTVLRGIDQIAFDNSSTQAKIVAKANTPPRKIETEYRLDVHANPGYGLWFEVGPAGSHQWDGAMLGTVGENVDFHGVGEKGALPQKTVLEYQMQGLKMDMGGKEYTAWAVKNHLDSAHSYYARVREMPQGILFGPLPEGDDAEVHMVDLY